MKIVTSYVNPPIPWRGADWCAHFDDYDGAPDSGWQPVGEGATEAGAIANLRGMVEEHDGERAEEYLALFQTTPLRHD